MGSAGAAALEPVASGGLACVAGAALPPDLATPPPGSRVLGLPGPLGMPEAVCGASPDLSLTQQPESSWEQGPEGHLATGPSRSSGTGPAGPRGLG